MSLTGLVGLLLGLLLSGSVLLLAWALRGRPPQRGNGTAPYTRPTTIVDGHAGSGVLRGAGARRRGLAAVAVGTIVLVATRWPVAAGACVAIVFLWPTMFGAGRSAEQQVTRIEALATWTESLRDSIAGSVGLEEAIRHSLHAAPLILHDPLQRLVGRLHAQVPLPQALSGFAEEFEDSSADLVVAALILNARLRGPGLVATLSALATAAREEVDLRRRIEEGRKSLRRTATIIIAVTGLFAGALTVLSRDYVAPYGSPFGQVMLAIVLTVFAGGLMWIRSAAEIRPPARFLVGIDQIDAALHATSRARRMGAADAATPTRQRRPAQGGTSEADHAQGWGAGRDAGKSARGSGTPRSKAATAEASRDHGATR